MNIAEKTGPPAACVRVRFRCVHIPSFMNPNRRSSFLFQLGRPIDDQGDGRGRLPGFVGNGKSLTVGGDIESSENPVGPSSKKGMSSANCKTRPARLPFTCHHFVLRAHIENL